MATVTTNLQRGTPALLRFAAYNQIVWDFATTPITAADIHTMWQCPTDYVVLSAGYKILTAETAGGACTLDMGKAGGTELLNAADMTAAANTKGIQTFTTPVAFTGSDTIDIQINTTLADDGKVLLWWVGIDVTPTTTAATV